MLTASYMLQSVHALRKQSSGVLTQLVRKADTKDTTEETRSCELYLAVQQNTGEILLLCKAAKALVRSSNEEGDIKEYSKHTLSNGFSTPSVEVIKMYCTSHRLCVCVCVGRRVSGANLGLETDACLVWPSESHTSALKGIRRAGEQNQGSQRFLTAPTLPESMGHI